VRLRGVRLRGLLRVGRGFRVGLRRFGGLLGALLLGGLLLLLVVLLHGVVRLRRGARGSGLRGHRGRGRGRLRAGRFRGLGKFGGCRGGRLRERSERRRGEQRGDQGRQLLHRFFLGGGYVK